MLYRRKSNTKEILRALVALAAFDAMLWYFVAAGTASGGSLELSFLSVGQGDSQLISIPNGREPTQILIDGGPDARVLGSLAQVLPASDRSLDLVVMTHPELDHFSGLVDVLTNYRIGAFIGTGRKRAGGEYGELQRVLAERGVPSIALREGDRIRIGDATLAAFGPSPDELASSELNDGSLVVMLEAGGLRALFTGDIGSDAERRLARDYDLRAHVLKVPHHGSRFSSSEPFVSEVRPRVAVIGVGKNRYGHPTPDVLERLAAVGARVLRTDRDGTVRMVRKGKNLELYTGGIDKSNRRRARYSGEGE